MVNLVFALVNKHLRIAIITLLFVCFSSFSQDYDLEVNKLLPKPVSISPISDLLSRAEYTVINNWFNNNPNNAALGLAYSIEKCDIEKLKSNSFRQEFNKQMEKELLKYKLETIFDKDLRSRMIGAIYSGLRIIEPADCTSIPAISSSKEQYDSLITFYSQFLDSVSELENIVEIAQSQNTTKQKISKLINQLDKSQQTQFSNDLKDTFENIKVVNLKELDSNKLLSITQTVLKSPLAKDLPKEISDVYTKLAKADELKNAYSTLELTIKSEMTPSEKIKKIQSIAGNYLGKNERRGLALTSIIARHNYGTIDGPEAVNAAVELFKHDMDGELVSAINIGNQLYNAMEGKNLNFNNLSGSDYASMAPAVTSIAKIALNVQAGSPDEKKIDAVMNIGVAYFTGNPMAMMGSISSLTGGGEGPSAQQQRHQAVMAQLNIINKKLDTVLENQEKMLVKLDGISDQITSVSKKLDVLKQVMVDSKINIMDSIGDLKPLTFKATAYYRSRTDCLVGYKSVSNELANIINKPTKNRHFKFQLRFGDSLDTGLPSIFENDSSSPDLQSAYSSWFKACYKFIKEINVESQSYTFRNTLFAENFISTSPTSKPTSQYFKETFSKLSSSVSCTLKNKDNKQVCIRRQKTSTDAAGDVVKVDNPKYLNKAERDVISIITRESNINFIADNLKDNNATAIFLSGTYMKDVNFVRWLTLNDVLGNMLNPIEVNVIAHITHDLHKYLSNINKDDNFYTMDPNISQMLPTLKKYLYLTILQQEILSGAMFSGVLVDKYYANNMQDADKKLMEELPEVTRRFLIQTCKSHITMMGNQCLDSLNQAVYENSPINLSRTLIFKKPINEITFSKTKAIINIDGLKLGFGQPTVDELTNDALSIATNSIHSRATLSLLNSIVH